MEVATSDAHTHWSSRMKDAGALGVLSELLATSFSSTARHVYAVIEI